MSEEIYFYKSTGQYGFLSNLYKSELEFEGETFPTSEHAYQRGKFNNQKHWDWVSQAPEPRFVCIVAHNLFPYDVVPRWSQLKLSRMRAVVRAKFMQNEDLREKLLATYPATLIENSKTDTFWGIGKNGKGKNMLGKLLMEVREELREGL
jgi:ribA/ribD-fused uncharacterized protein